MSRRVRTLPVFTPEVLRGEDLRAAPISTPSGVSCVEASNRTGPGGGGESSRNERAGLALATAAQG